MEHGVVGLEVRGALPLRLEAESGSGMMEYWNNGMLGKVVLEANILNCDWLLTHYSILPAFQHSC